MTNAIIGSTFAMTKMIWFWLIENLTMTWSISIATIHTSLVAKWVVITWITLAMVVVMAAFEYWLFTDGMLATCAKCYYGEMMK